ncbi:MAG: 3-phosphoshikimate 1-carboxyvinyltransferase [Lachnospiraceae bacterium]|nr:3-phosphoshikimate 1-carboxyvinyltransferase [Lachnospiraceae bacterium]
MDQEIIQGNRIYLKPITADDTEMVLKWRNSDRTVRNFYYRDPVTSEDHAKWLSEKVDKGEVWQYIVCLKDGDIPVGSVYLQHFDTATLTGESGVFFSEDAPSGEGLATEAVKLIGEKAGFDKLGLLRITAKVMASNKASIRLHEKAGYRLRNEVKGDVCSDGSVVDSLWFVRNAPVYRMDRKPLLKAKTGKISVLNDASGGRLMITVPGSKSITNRSLLTAMLADGESVIRGVLFSDDTESFLSCMEALGIEAEADRRECIVRVKGCAGNIPSKESYLNVGSAGTAARFLTAVLGLCNDGIYHMDSSEQMRKRPMAPLLNSLKELGCEVIYEGEEGFFPFTLKPHGFASDSVSVDIDKSSQFLSALLIAAPMSDKGLNVKVTGTHGLSYVAMTMKIMEAFGAKCSKAGTDICGDEAGTAPDGNGPGYFVEHGRYSPADYQIEPDASAAAYFFAMSPLIGKDITVKGLHPDSMQGDTGFVKVLENAQWIRFRDEAEGITVTPVQRPLGCSPEHAASSEGADSANDEIMNKSSRDMQVTDMSSCSDQTITFAAIAPYFDRSIRITGISHIRHQESDRISAIVSELKRMGAEAEADGDDIVIAPSKICPAEIETYNDHRMAMGFSLDGLKDRDLTILDPLCCAKTFPDYFAFLDEIMNL